MKKEIQEAILNEEGYITVGKGITEKRITGKGKAEKR
jgi:hypothetical protein